MYICLFLFILLETATGPLLVQYTITQIVQLPSHFKVRNFTSSNFASQSSIHSKSMYKVSVVSTKLYYFDSELFIMIQLQIIISILYPDISPYEAVFLDYIEQRVH